MSKVSNKKKRVCIVRQKPYPWQRNMRRNAETLSKEGYEVDVVCIGLKGQKKFEIMNGVNVHRVYYSYHRNKVFWYLLDYSVFFFLVSLKLVWLSLRNRFNVIEICNVPDFLVFTTIFPKILGTKVIYYMFEKTEALFTASFHLSNNHLLTRLIRCMIKLCATFANSVIATDVLVEKQLLESYHIRSDKVTLVLNVVDEDVFKLEPAVPTEKDDHFTLTIVSGTLKRYGIQTMVQAFPILLKDIPKLKLNIVGDGEYLPNLQKMVDELNIKDHITFTGYIPYEEVPPYIACADVCIAPMLDDVGTPNKVLEYFAMGKATVSSKIPGLVALIDCECLLYFQPGNEIELAERILELYHSPEKRASLGALAQEFYSQYRWSSMKQKYLGVYRKLMGIKT
jgi:glycosyltransferase involved in cell wall biosynthesis